MDNLLPPHTKSVHRRVTSMCMTSCKEAIALSCWDGSAFVYVANSPPGNITPCASSTSWELHSGRDSPLPTSLNWEQPTIFSDGLFPTFVELKFNYGNISQIHGKEKNKPFSVRGKPGILVMVVSTPRTDKIRCFDVFSGVQCPDIYLGKVPSRGEIHGIVTASCSNSINGDDALVWVTEENVIHSQQWSILSKTAESYGVISIPFFGNDGSK